MRKLRTIEMNRLTLEEFKEAEKLPLIVVLDDVRSLYNVGSVFRSCDAFRVEEEKGYAVIFGNEVKGVKQNIVDMSDGCLEIPQFGTKHSLNVSVTAGIVVWEFAKLIIIH